MDEWSSDAPIIEGMLKKRSNMGLWQKRYFFLSAHGGLVYFRSEKELKKRQGKSESIPLHQIETVVVGREANGNILDVKLADHLMRLQAKDEQEACEWAQAITMAVAEARNGIEAASGADGGSSAAASGSSAGSADGPASPDGGQANSQQPGTTGDGPSPPPPPKGRPPASAQDTVDELLPSNWARVQLEDGSTYYWNCQTTATSWFHPSLKNKARMRSTTLLAQQASQQTASLAASATAIPTAEPETNPAAAGIPEEDSESPADPEGDKEISQMVPASEAASEEPLESSHPPKAEPIAEDEADSAGSAATPASDAEAAAPVVVSDSSGSAEPPSTQDDSGETSEVVASSAEAASEVDPAAAAPRDSAPAHSLRLPTPLEENSPASPQSPSSAADAAQPTLASPTGRTRRPIRKLPPISPEAAALSLRPRRFSSEGEEGAAAAPSAAESSPSKGSAVPIAVPAEPADFSGVVAATASSAGASVSSPGNGGTSAECVVSHCDHAPTYSGFCTAHFYDLFALVDGAGQCSSLMELAEAPLFGELNSRKNNSDEAAGPRKKSLAQLVSPTNINDPHTMFALRLTSAGVPGLGGFGMDCSTLPRLITVIIHMVVPHELREERLAQLQQAMRSRFRSVLPPVPGAASSTAAKGPRSTTSSYALLFLLADILFDRSTAESVCRCAKTPCPVFVLRLFWGSACLAHVFDPFLKHPGSTTRTLLLKICFRWFQLLHNLPNCQRYSALQSIEHQPNQTRPGNGLRALGYYMSLACRPSVLTRQLVNLQFEMLTNQVPLARTAEDEERSHYLEDGFGDPPYHDLFQSKIRNPLLLPLVFNSMRGTDLAFRAEILENIYGVVVGKPATALAFLQQDYWQLWFFRLLTDVPAPAGLLARRTLLQPPGSPQPQIQPQPPSSANLDRRKMSVMPGAGVTPQPPPTPPPSSPEEPEAAGPSLGEAEPLEDVPGDEQVSGGDASSRRSSSSSGPPPATPIPPPQPLGSALVLAPVAAASRRWDPDAHRVFSLCVGFFRALHTYTMNEWDGFRFLYQLLETLILLRRFTNGFHNDALYFARKFNRGLLTSLNTKQFYSLISNDNTFGYWENTFKIIAVNLRLMLFTQCVECCGEELPGPHAALSSSASSLPGAPSAPGSFLVLPGSTSGLPPASPSRLGSQIPPATPHRPTRSMDADSLEDKPGRGGTVAAALNQATPGNPKGSASPGLSGAAHSSPSRGPRRRSEADMMLVSELPSLEAEEADTHPRGAWAELPEGSRAGQGSVWDDHRRATTVMRATAPSGGGTGLSSELVVVEEDSSSSASGPSAEDEEEAVSSAASGSALGSGRARDVDEDFMPRSSGGGSCSSSGSAAGHLPTEELEFPSGSSPGADSGLGGPAAPASQSQQPRSAHAQGQSVSASQARRPTIVGGLPKAVPRPPCAPRPAPVQHLLERRWAQKGMTGWDNSFTGGVWIHVQSIWREDAAPGEAKDSADHEESSGASSGPATSGGDKEKAAFRWEYECTDLPQARTVLRLLQGLHCHQFNPEAQSSAGFKTKRELFHQENGWRVYQLFHELVEILSFRRLEEELEASCLRVLEQQQQQLIAQQQQAMLAAANSLPPSGSPALMSSQSVAGGLATPTRGMSTAGLGPVRLLRLGSTPMFEPRGSAASNTGPRLSMFAPPPEEEEDVEERRCRERLLLEYETARMVDPGLARCIPGDLTMAEIEQLLYSQLELQRLMNPAGVSDWERTLDQPFLPVSASQTEALTAASAVSAPVAAASRDPKAQETPRKARRKSRHVSVCSEEDDDSEPPPELSDSEAGDAPSDDEDDEDEDGLEPPAEDDAEDLTDSDSDLPPPEDSDFDDDLLPPSTPPATKRSLVANSPSSPASPGGGRKRFDLIRAILREIQEMSPHELRQQIRSGGGAPMGWSASITSSPSMSSVSAAAAGGLEGGSFDASASEEQSHNHRRMTTGRAASAATAPVGGTGGHGGDAAAGADMPELLSEEALRRYAREMAVKQASGLGAYELQARVSQQVQALTQKKAGKRTLAYLMNLAVLRSRLPIQSPIVFEDTLKRNLGKGHVVDCYLVLTRTHLAYNVGVECDNNHKNMTLIHLSNIQVNDIACLQGAYIVNADAVGGPASSGSGGGGGGSGGLGMMGPGGALDSAGSALLGGGASDSGVGGAGAGAGDYSSFTGAAGARADSSHSFELVTPKDSYIFMAESASKKQEWLSVLTQAVAKMEAKTKGDLGCPGGGTFGLVRSLEAEHHSYQAVPGRKRTHRREVSGYDPVDSNVLNQAVNFELAAEPVWVPKNSVDRCCGCKQRFTLLKKKRYCQGCGLVFCDSCTKDRHAFRGEKNVEKRVCKECLSMLNKRKKRRMTELVALMSSGKGGK